MSLLDSRRADGTRAVAFETSMLSPERRFAFWREGALSETIPFDVERLSDQPFVGAARVVGTVDLYMTRLKADSHALVRSQSEVATGAGGTAAICLVNRGTLVMDQRGRTVVGLPGDLVIVYEDVPFRVVFREICDYTSVRINSGRFPMDIRSRSPLVLTPRASPLATVTAGYIRSLPLDVRALAGMSDLVATQLGALALQGVDRPIPVAGRRAFDAIQRVVETEIGNPDLSSKLLCDRLGLSRTALFEAVSAEGHTLAGLILDRRLSACIGDMQRLGKTETLATISNRWGFRDQSSFTRAFRRRFGEAPTRWRAPATDG